MILSVFCIKPVASPDGMSALNKWPLQISERLLRCATGCHVISDSACSACCMRLHLSRISFLMPHADLTDAEMLCVKHYTAILVCSQEGDGVAP